MDSISNHLDLKLREIVINCLNLITKFENKHIKITRNVVSIFLLLKIVCFSSTNRSLRDLNL